MLVTVEREMQWRDGSVASGVWLFRIYQERDDGDEDKLADWVLRNRGNDWLPFGDYTSARSLDEWRSGRLPKARSYGADVEHHQYGKQSKQDRAGAREKTAAERRAHLKNARAS